MSAASNEKKDAIRDHKRIGLDDHECKTPIGRRYTLAQIDEAMATLGKGEGKPVLLPR